MERLVFMPPISDYSLSNGLHTRTGICAWVDQNLLLLNTLKNVVIYCSQENLLQPPSFTPVCRWHHLAHG